jgi:hypothetical protein
LHPLKREIPNDKRRVTAFNDETGLTERRSGRVLSGEDFIGGRIIA